MNCALAIERSYRGEEGVFVGLFRAPEQQTIAEIQHWVGWYKNEAVEKVGFFRMALRFGHVPRAIRRMLWWGTLNVSGNGLLQLPAWVRGLTELTDLDACHNDLTELPPWMARLARITRICLSGSCS